MANRTGPGGAAEEEEEDDDDPVVSFPELLRFCGRAQTLIAELLLLADRVPSEFHRRFDPVIFDLRYFDSPSDFQSRIEGNAELEALEDQLCESCSNYMQRFFNLASGIVIYHMELLKYLNVLQEGLYVHYSLDSVLESKSGCQLLTESITLFACLLLLMELRIIGILREKLLVAHLLSQRYFLQDSHFLNRWLMLLYLAYGVMTCTITFTTILIHSTGGWLCHYRAVVCTCCYFILPTFYIMVLLCERLSISSLRIIGWFPYFCISR